MTAMVFVSGGGRRYHDVPDCLKLLSARDLWDWDCDEYCRHDHGRPRAIQALPLAEAVALGRQPCVGCNPLAGTVEAESFGHVPHQYDGVDICQRCYATARPDWAGVNYQPQGPGGREVVHWPCSTSIILGLPSALAAREGS